MVSFYELAEKALALEKSGQSVIKLNVGDTKLPTPPEAIDAAVNFMKTAKCTYVSSAGITELREKIAEREKCKVENVVVGPGSKQLIFALLSILAKKGERIRFPSPYWAAYELIAKQLGLKSEIVETRLEDNWQLSENTDFGNNKVSIICNPLNPTSTVYSEKNINELLGETDEDAHVILDEAYKGLSFKQIPIYENTIRVRSFSKEFNMEGWRLAYAVAPKEIADKLISFNQISTTCVPEFIQRAGIACLEKEKETLELNKRIWMDRIEFMATELRKAGFRFAKPDAGIYIFATHPEMHDADKLAIAAVEKGVVVAPGNSFGNYKKFIRICPSCKQEEMKKAVEVLNDCLNAPAHI